jgi:pimeloyl-ACP methyl ester carboxylesterase
MTEKTILLLHGFASSGKSAKAKYLKAKFSDLPGIRFVPFDFNPTPRDFEYMTVSGMIDRLRQELNKQKTGELHLIGSSMGGLVALHYAARYGGDSLLLLAPLLSYQSLGMTHDVIQWWKKRGFVEIDHYGFPGKLPLRYHFHQDAGYYREMIPPPAPTRIIHGVHDRQVHIDNSRVYAEDFPEQVELYEVDSDHGLADQYGVIWEHIHAYFLRG